MNQPAFESPPASIFFVWLQVSLRKLASPRLSVVLLVILVAVLVWATLMESARGREYSHWYVYDSRGFAVLLGLLGLNMLAAALARMPWRRQDWKRQTIGLLITRAGLLVLLFAAVQSHFAGIQGVLVLREGKEVSEFVVASHSVIRIAHTTGQREISTELSFAPGPVDWPEDRELDFGQSRGLGVKILKYYRHAVEYSAWLEDEQDYQGPALQLRLDNAQGEVVAEDWLAATAFGGEAVIGPTGYQLWPLTVATMLEDFRQPPVDNLGSAGVLSMHHGGKMYRAPIDGQVGTRLPIGDTGMEVEITGYHPDARPSPQGGFYSRSQRARNPLLQLQLHLPEGHSMAQLAFARRPLLTTDGVTGDVCPVRFWYHHPDVPPTPGADFVQTPDGKLYCRTTNNDRRGEAVELHVGDRVPLGSRFSFVLLQYLPHARQDKGFRPIRVSHGAESTAEAAVLLEVNYDGRRQEVWMKREDPQFRFASIVTRQGRVMLSFDYQQVPLGYTVKLKEVIRDPHATHQTNVALASQVELLDDSGTTIGHHTIAINEPLTCGKFTLCPSNGYAADQNQNAAVLAVAWDPGRVLKYTGSWLICGGMLLMFVQRSHLFRSLPCLPHDASIGSHQCDDREGGGPQPASRHVPEPLGLRRLAASRHRESDVDQSIS